jgi:ferritin-like metal-binding protein YciE
VRSAVNCRSGIAIAIGNRNMSLFSKTQLTSPQDLFSLKLQDLYDAEQRLVEALPKMAEAASEQSLRTAFQSHLKETRQHVERLEKVFGQMDCNPKRHTCHAMKGLIAEGDEVIAAEGDPRVKDEALITAAQSVEHYEIASYRAMRDLAERLGYDRAAGLFRATLDEEMNADKTLREITIERPARRPADAGGGDSKLRSRRAKSARV